MSSSRSLIVFAALFAACSSAERPPSDSSWAVPFGGEFWRAKARTQQLPVSATDALDRVRHAMTPAPGGGVFEGEYDATFGEAGATIAHVPVRTKRFSAAGIERLAGASPAFRVVGNTAQAPLDAEKTIVEHFEAREEGLEWTWVVRRPVPGPLAIEASVGNLRAVADGENLAFLDDSGARRLRVSHAVAVDAQGRRWPLELESREGGFGLVVPSEVLETAVYPLAIDPLLSPEIALDKATRLTSVATTPKIAWAGTTGLVAWLDTEATPSVVQAIRIDATGAALDAVPQAVVTGGVQEFALAANATTFVVAALNVRTGSATLTLPTTVRISAATGAILDTMPNDLAAATGVRSGIAIGSNGTDFAVAWRFGTNEIWGARVNGTTGVPDTGVRIWTNAVSLFAVGVPAVVAPDGGDFGVFWGVLPPGASCSSFGNVYGARLRGTDGALLDTTPLSVTGNRTTSEFRITGAAGASESVLSIEILGCAGSELWSYRVPTTFATPTSTRVTTGTSAVPLSGASVIRVGTNYLFTWSQPLNPATGRDVFAARINGSDNSLVDPFGFSLYVAAADQYIVRPVATGTGGNLVLLYTDGGVTSGAWTLPLTGSGAAYSASGTAKVVTTREDTDLTPAVASNAATTLVVWQGNRNRVNSLDWDILAARIDTNTGALLDAQPLLVATGSAPQTAPVVATNGTDFLVAWTTSGSFIEVARVTAAGSVGFVTRPSSSSSRVIGPVPVSNGYVIGYLIGGVLSLSRLFADGSLNFTRVLPLSGIVDAHLAATSNLLVAAVATSSSTTGYDLFAMRVDPANLVTPDTSGIAVSRLPGDQRFPRVVPQGADALVFWEDLRNARAEIDEAKVDTTLGAATPFPAGRTVIADAGPSFPTPPPFDAVGDASAIMVAWMDPPTRAMTVERFLPDFTPLDGTAFRLSADGYGPPALATVGLARFFATFLHPSTTGYARATLVGIGDPPQVSGADAQLTAVESTPASLPAVTVPAGARLELDTPPAHGSVSITGGTITYTPAAGYVGTDRFTWRARSWLFTSASSWTVDVTVNADATPPTASPSTVATDEDTAVNTPLSATDPRSRPLTYTVVTTPAHGTLSGTAPALRYTPAKDYNGPDSFTWKANNGRADSTVATVTLNVRPVNDAPTVAPATLTTDEDTAGQVIAAGSDVDGDALTYRLGTAPAHGQVTNAGATFTYTPAKDYNGPDSFTILAADATLSSAPATVTVTVRPVNDAPKAASVAIATSEDAATGFDASTSDIDGDALAYSVRTTPAHGTVTGTLPTGTYTPNPGYWGSDSFVVAATDGALTGLVTVAVTVNHVNHAPTASGRTVTLPEDGATTVHLDATDPDRDPLEFHVLSSPQHGSLSGSPPDVAFVPDPNYNGPDSFTFEATDGEFTTAPARIDLVVTPVNDPPVAAPGAVTTREDTPVVISLSATDVDGDTLRATIATPPAHGRLTGQPPTVQYVPEADFNGTDAFTWIAQDGGASSAPAKITITVTAVNDAPQAVAGAAILDEDATAAIVLRGTDVDGDNLTYRVVRAPVHGTLSGSAPALTYRPAADFHGPDDFTFTVSDGSLTSAPATFSFTVRAVNDAPVPQPASYTTAEDVPVLLLLAATDVDGDALKYAIVAPPQHGTLAGDAPDLLYTPAPDYHGADELTFQVTDGTVVAGPVRVTFDVTSVNDAPTARGGTVTTARNRAVSLVFSGTDPDGDTLSFEVLTPPANGALEGSGANRTYVPAKDFKGHDRVLYVATDGLLRSAPVNIEILVEQGNRPPTADAATKDTLEDTALSFTLTGSDFEGAPLTFTVTAPPLHGTLTGTAPDLVFTPAPDWNGYDELSFTVDDGADVSAPATVALHVLPVNDKPRIEGAKLATAKETAVTVTLVATDADGDKLKYGLVTEPAHGKAELAGAVLTYTPAAGFVGVDTLKVEAIDTFTDSEPALVEITVGSPTDDPLPVDAGTLAGGCSTSGAGLLALLGLLARRRRA